MPVVYILQEEGSNLFKIGRSGSTSETAHQRLRTGNPRPLVLFHQIETEDETGCEGMFHRLLGADRVRAGGGTEFFEMEPDKMRQQIERIHTIFSQLQTARAEVETLRHERSEDRILETTEYEAGLCRRLHQLRQEREAIDLQIELLESKLKQRIGKASGIQGVASWKTQLRRCYDESIFKDRDPALYEQVLERFYCVDTKRWRKEDAALYTRVQTTHYRSEYSRPFKLLR